MTGFDFLLNFPYEIGLGEKIPAVVSALAQSKFTTVATTPTLIIYTTAAGDQIIITPAQFRFTSHRQIKIEEMKPLLECVPNVIFSILQADDLFCNLHIVDIQKVNHTSAFDITKNSIPPILNDIDGLVGIGYRLFFQSNTPTPMYDEFKCEPWLQNEDYLFMEGFMNFAFNRDFSITNALDCAYTKFDKLSMEMYGKLTGG